MLRPVVVALLATALLAGGCARERVALPPGENPDQLVAAIAAKGQETRAAEPAPPDPTFQQDCLRHTFQFGYACLLVPFYAGIIVLKCLTNMSPGTRIVG